MIISNIDKIKSKEMYNLRFARNLGRLIVSFTIINIRNIRMVPWMSGLVSGLQNHVRQFESARHLSKNKIGTTLVL